MIDEHRHCPNCESTDTEVVNTEFYVEEIQRVRICNDCPTEWIVSYGDPVVREVEQYE